MKPGHQWQNLGVNKLKLLVTRQHCEDCNYCWPRRNEEFNLKPKHELPVGSGARNAERECAQQKCPHADFNHPQGLHRLLRSFAAVDQVVATDQRRIRVGD